LTQENNICERVVYSQYRHCWEDVLEDGAEDVEDIAEEPDDEEGEGEAVGGGAPEVFDYLGGEDYDPAGY